jgi:hypothetical protein
MHELILLLEELGDSGLQVQIDQIHGTGDFFHQSTKQAIETLGRTATDAYVQV